MIEIHICPILMRTVKFIDDRCTEPCKEDCPVQEYREETEEE
jgi:hypothetical protein